MAIESTESHVTLQNMIDETQKNISIIQNDHHVRVNVYWIPGHAELEPNEAADKAAKEAAQEASVSEIRISPSLNVVKNIIRRQVITKWQKSWNWSDQSTSTECYRLLPVVPKQRYKSSVTHNRSLETKFIRLLSGHSRLNNHIHKLFPTESACCECGNERQTVRHVMMDCTINQEARLVLFDCIDKVYHQHNTPIWERELSLDTLLSPQHTDIDTRQQIRRLIIKYITSIQAKI